MKTDAQNCFALSVPVTTGTNTLTVVSTDVNTNSTTNTATFTVANTGSRTFSYDLNGFTTNDGSRTYEWDGAGRLVKIGHAGTGNRTEFTYDGLSRRVRLKEVTNNVTALEQRFVYDGLGIAERRAADGTTVERRYYVQGFEQVGGADAGRYFYARDHLGSIRALVDASGTLRGQWSYSLWGSRGTNEVTVNAVDSDFGYTGHLEHGRSGLVFALYRAYDPVIARWLSRDPIGQSDGPNVYSYVLNDPINLWDPWGLEAQIYVYRTSRTSMTTVMVFENGAYLGGFYGNLKGYVEGTRAPPSGRYTLQPKNNYDPGDKFVDGTPSITGDGLKPGQPEPGDLGTHRVHPEGESEGCQTGPLEWADRIWDIMDRNISDGGTFIHYITGVRLIRDRACARAMK